MAYAEAHNIWPDHEVQMLAIGTGASEPNHIYDAPSSPTFYAMQVFNEMFGGKEEATIVPLLSMAQRNDLNLSRINPIINALLERTR